MSLDIVVPDDLSAAFAFVLTIECAWSKNIEQFLRNSLFLEWILTKWTGGRGLAQPSIDAVFAKYSFTLATTDEHFLTDSSAYCAKELLDCRFRLFSRLIDCQFCWSLLFSFFLSDFWDSICSNFYQYFPNFLNKLLCLQNSTLMLISNNFPHFIIWCNLVLGASQSLRSVLSFNFWFVYQLVFCQLWLCVFPFENSRSNTTNEWLSDEDWLTYLENTPDMPPFV